MDLITGLPASTPAYPPSAKPYDAILVFVDRLTKMSHFVPTYTNINSKTWALLFKDYVFKYHGLPDSFISDRGSIFNSDFTKELTSILGVKLNLSTAFHPQTDGQTEAIN